ncbi:MAG: methyltransferase domain-containing protein [Armatimonadetes bacterium]|nr:methyltransferase domain-containing protein [Armatimonadota bacterium]
MSRDSAVYKELAAGLAAFAAESGGDLQRYVIAPAMLDMIGPVSGKDVLDIYCGAGYLSRRLATMGAKVTAVDTSDRLIGIAGELDKREEHGIRYVVAQPTDLSAIGDSVFDDIVCNMGLLITKDLPGTVSELARLVKLGGRFIFSVLHPCFTMPDACWISDEDGKLLYKALDNYFAESWHISEVGPVIRGEDTKVKHRTLSTYVNALSARGFNVRRIAEPRPLPDVVAVKPHLEVFARLPVVLIVEAVFPYF